MLCSLCDIGYDNYTHRPDAVSFAKYIPFFLQDNPDYLCAKAGHAAYSQVIIGVSILNENETKDLLY